MPLWFSKALMVESAFSAKIPEGLRADDVDALNGLLASLLGGAPFPKDYLPMIAPAMLLGARGLEAATALMQPPEGMGVVHESQVFRREEAIPLGAPLFVEVLPETKGAVRKLGFALGSDDRALGEMETRLRFVTPDIMSSLKGAHFKPSMDDPEMQWIDTTAFSRERVAHYLELSHDPNPIHRDDDAARDVGLPQAVVPGMLIAGLCEAAAHRLGFRSSEMRTRFMAPLAVEASIRIGVKVTDGTNAKARAFAVSDQDQILAISDFKPA